VSTKIFGLVPELPWSTKCWLAIVVVLNAACSYVFETFLIIRLFSRYWQRRAQKQSQLRAQRASGEVSGPGTSYVGDLNHPAQQYNQKGVRIPNNEKLRDSNDDGIGNQEQAEARCVIEKS